VIKKAESAGDSASFLSGVPNLLESGKNQTEPLEKKKNKV
jgi:hypothetical protein